MTTRSELRLDLSRNVNDLIATGIPTAVTGTTLADTVNLVHVLNNQRKGYIVFIYAGTGIGQERIASASTAESALITVPTWTTNPDTTTSYYELHRTWNVTEYNQAIDAAFDAARFYMLVDKYNESIILNNLLSNGLMATHSASSGSTACTGWTGDANSTFTRESSIIYGRTYSEKIVTKDTNVGTFSQSVANFPLYAEKSATLKGWLYSSTASRVTMRLYDGVNTWNTTALDGTEGWVGPDSTIPVSLNSKSLSESLTELTASIQVSAGTAVTVYVGRMELYCPTITGMTDYVHYYTIPTGFYSIDQVEMETSVHNDFFPLKQGIHYKVIREGTRRIYFPSPIDGRAIRIKGKGIATKPTADTSTIELNEEYVINYASLELLKIRTRDTAERLYYADAQRNLVMRYATPIPANTQMVEAY